MTRSALALIALSACVTVAPATVTQTSAQALTEAVPLVLPTRRPPAAPPAGPPDVPPDLDRITPLRITATLRRVPAGGRPTALQQTITRTGDRVHAARSDKREWLFERNPVDPRRVSGLLVEHAARTIVMYEESDLRLGLGIRGWADVLSLGMDPDIVRRLSRSGKTRTIGGIEFAYYSDSTDGDHDLWWSSAHGFASRFVTRDATAITTFSVERVSHDVDSRVLEPPSARFPSYRLIDLAEWQEHR